MKIKGQVVLLLICLVVGIPTGTGCVPSLPTVIQTTEKILVMLSEAQAALQAMKAIVDHLVSIRPDIVSSPVVRKFYLAHGKAQAALQHASQATQAARRAETSPDPLTVFAEFKTAYAELAEALGAVRALAGVSGAAVEIEVPEAAR